MHEVMSELRSTAAKKATAAVAEEEQRARVESGVHRTYWTVDPADVSAAKAPINEEILRRGCKATSIESSAAGRAEKIHEHAMHIICEELRRAVAQNEARLVILDEQQRRTCEQWMHEVMSELRSTAAKRATAAAAEEEQRARVESGVHRTYWTVDPADVSAAKAPINEDIHRRGNKWAARAMSQVAIDEAAHQHRMLQLCEELERAVNQSTAKLAANDEHRRRICEQWMHEVMSELRSTAAKRATAAVAEEEQRARVESGVHRTYWTVDPADVSAAKAPINEEIL